MPTGSRIRTDNVFGTVTDNPLTAGALTLNSAGLVNLAAVASNHAVIVLDPLRAAGAPEIVIVTAHTAAASSATITRGAYGTTARSHAAGVLWVHAPTTEDTIRIVTSGTRPSDPYRGQLVFETDTNSYVGRDTSDAWQTAVQMGAWTAFTPTLTQSATVTKTVTYAKYVRLGRVISANISVVVTGAGTASNAIVAGLPVAVATGVTMLGVGYIYDASANAVYKATVEVGSPTTSALFRPASATGNDFLGANAPMTAALASGDLIVYAVTYEAAS